MSGRSLRIDGHSLDIGNWDKVLFPDAGITKGDLVEYWRDMAEIALPHMKDRPLTMHRFPEGIGGEGFYQKRAGDYFPDFVRTARLPSGEGDIDYVVADSAATLAYMADQASIELHGFLSRIDKPDYPDRLIFDLDPSGNDFSAVQDAARLIRDAFADAEVPAFVQTTGSRGLHVTVPLDRTTDFDTARKIAGGFTKRLAAAHPDTLTTAQRKAKREGRLYLDIMRNAYGQTGIMPYSPRAREGAPVATPLDWGEALEAGLSPRQYTIRNIRKRLAQKDDPWAGFARHGIDAKRLEDCCRS